MENWFYEPLAIQIVVAYANSYSMFLQADFSADSRSFAFKRGTTLFYGIKIQGNVLGRSFKKWGFF